MKIIPSPPATLADLIQTPAPDPNPIERYVKDEERRKWQDSDNLARIAKALERDPQAVEQATGPGRWRPFPVSEWLEALQVWQAIFFKEYDRHASNHRITRDEFMDKITGHHPNPILRGSREMAA